MWALDLVETKYVSNVDLHDAPRDSAFSSFCDVVLHPQFVQETSEEHFGIVYSRKQEDYRRERARADEEFKAKESAQVRSYRQARRQTETDLQLYLSHTHLQDGCPMLNRSNGDNKRSIRIG